MVSTRCPWGPEEVLGYGTYGLLWSVEDIDELATCIPRLLRDPDEAAWLTRLARERAQELKGKTSHTGARTVVTQSDAAFRSCERRRSLRKHLLTAASNRTLTGLYAVGSDAPRFEIHCGRAGVGREISNLAVQPKRGISNERHKCESRL